MDHGIHGVGHQSPRWIVRNRTNEDIDRSWRRNAWKSKLTSPEILANLQKEGESIRGQIGKVVQNNIDNVTTNSIPYGARRLNAALTRALK